MKYGADGGNKSTKNGIDPDLLRHLRLRYVDSDLLRHLRIATSIAMKIIQIQIGIGIAIDEIRRRWREQID